MKSQNILLVAYQCGPDMGSVSQIGWEWFTRLSTDHHVTLVTHIRNRPAIEKEKLQANSKIIYIDTEWFAGPVYRMAKRVFPHSEHSVFLVSSIDYFAFDFAAYRQLKKLLKQGAEWEVLHRVTPVTLAAPTCLGRLGLPMVIGPLNSGLTDPPGFKKIMKQESTWLSHVRSLRFLPDVLLGSTRLASRILTANATTRQGVSPRYHDRCMTMSENGIAFSQFNFTPWPEAPDATHPLRVLFVGRLTPVKGLNLLIQAIAKMHHSGCPVLLDVVGDGPMYQQWYAMSKLHGLANVVTFHGAQPHHAISGFMQQCHVFCLPSVRESGGAVLLEAMASARPVIALNHGGPSEIVTNNEGALLPIASPSQVIFDLAKTLMDIPHNPTDWRQRGIEGSRRVETTYSWQAKIKTVEKIYHDVLTEKGLVKC